VSRIRGRGGIHVRSEPNERFCRATASGIAATISCRATPQTGCIAPIGDRHWQLAAVWRNCDQNFGGPNLVDLSAVFVASTLSSIAGFAFSAICGAMLFHLLTKPVQIVQIMLVCSIAIQALSVATLRNAIEWKSLARFLYGGLVGLPLGVYLLTHFASHVYLRCIGIFLIGYGLFMIVRQPPKTIISNVIGDYVAGFLGGVTGGFAAFPGAFVTIWCGLKGWPKDRQRGVY
jgi:hypothetical protein